MQRRDRVRFAHTQLVELQRLIAAGSAIGFVDHQEDRRPGCPSHQPLAAAQDLGHFLVGRGDAAVRIGQEQHGIRLLDGQLGLGADLLDEIRRSDRERLAPGAGLGGIDPAGIDDVKADRHSIRLRPGDGRGWCRGLRPRWPGVPRPGG